MTCLLLERDSNSAEIHSCVSEERTDHQQLSDSYSELQFVGAVHILGLKTAATAGVV